MQACCSRPKKAGAQLSGCGSASDLSLLEHAGSGEFRRLLSLLAVAHDREAFFIDPETLGMDKFNIFDLVVVVFCTIDLWILPAIAEAATGNMTFVRLVRLARLSRGLKVIRVMKAFSKLRILVRTVAASFMALLWSMVLLGLLNFGFAIFLCQLLQPSLEVHWTYAFLFALYVSVVVFAVTRIITALFLKDTLQIASNDADMMIHESLQATKKDVAKLREIFELADKSKDGLLTLDELEDLCRIPEVRVYMHLLELEFSEVKGLFSLLDSGRGHVSLTEFVAGVMRLKGHARSLDVVAVMKDCEAILRRCKLIEDAMQHATMRLQNVSIALAPAVHNIAPEVHSI